MVSRPDGACPQHAQQLRVCGKLVAGRWEHVVQTSGTDDRMTGYQEYRGSV